MHGHGPMGFRRVESVRSCGQIPEAAVRGYGSRVSLRIAVLGPVAGWVDDAPVDLGPLKQKSVLAVLAAHVGREVPTDVLIDAVWGEDADPRVKRSIQTYVSNLRRLLGTQVVTGTRSGYLLDPAVTVDWVEFEQAAESDDPARLETALGLWRGDPFSDVESDWARPHVAAWTEQRLHAVERWSHLVTEQGRPTAPIPMLERLVVEHPTRETLWAALMTCLDGAGRKPDALAAYQRLRTTLADQLGIDPSPNIRALEEQILLSDQQERPPPAIGTPLPVAHTRLIGREDQLAQVVETLEAHRLVSLLGPGGSGKTRLAIEAAGNLATAAHFVDLSRIGDPDQVPQSVATALGVAIRGGTAPDQTPLAQLGRGVAGRQLLVVLDNCEHVIETAAETVSVLLSSSPELRVLTTSREPLGLPGEHRHQVPPLPIEAAGQKPALSLLLERAKEATGESAIGDDDVEVLARVAEVLEGMPLAIELAAAQLAFLTPTELRASLSERLTMTAGSGIEPRHQTLQATMEWSWQLLDDDEKQVLAELSVFSGGWTLDAAEGICTPTATPIRHILGSLVAKSLARPQRNWWGTRYRFLETVRLFGLRQLGDRRSELQHRHAAWFSDWCASWSLEDHFASAELSSRLTFDHENLHVALLHLVRNEDFEPAAEIVAAHANTWRGNHRGREALEWTDLIDPERLPLALRCKWMLSRGAALQVNDRYAEMWALTEEAATLAESTGDAMLIAVAKVSGSFGYLLRDADRHAAAWDDAIEAARLAGSRGLEAAGYAMQAFGSYLYGEPASVYNELVARAEAVELELGWNRSIQSQAAGLIRIANGDLDGALEVSLTNTGWDEMGLVLVGTRNNLAIVFVAARAGRSDVWGETLRRSHLHLSISLGGRADGDVLLGFAAWEVFQGDPLRGSELLSSVRNGHMEFPETYVKYRDIVNHLVGLELDQARVREARARGGATKVSDALRHEVERRGWN